MSGTASHGNGTLPVEQSQHPKQSFMRSLQPSNVRPLRVNDRAAVSVQMIDLAGSHLQQFLQIQGNFLQHIEVLCFQECFKPD